MSLVYGGVSTSPPSFCWKWFFCEVKVFGGREFCQATDSKYSKMLSQFEVSKQIQQQSKKVRSCFFSRKQTVCGENAWICLGWVFLYRILPWQITIFHHHLREYVLLFPTTSRANSTIESWGVPKKIFINKERCEIIPSRFWSAPVELLIIIDLYSKKHAFVFFGRSFGMATMFFWKVRLRDRMANCFGPLDKNIKTVSGEETKPWICSRWTLLPVVNGDITPLIGVKKPQLPI